MSKSISEWVKEIHEYAKKKGWWDSEIYVSCPNCTEEFHIPRQDSEVYALIHSEVSEAVEENRDSHEYVYIESTGKPEGEPIELADILIRIFDYAGKKGYDLERAIEIKHEYNLKRPIRHGKKW